MIETEMCSIYTQNRYIKVRNNVENLSTLYDDLKKAWHDPQLIVFEFPLKSGEVYLSWSVQGGWIISYKEVEMVEGKLYKEGVYEVEIPSTKKNK